MRQLFSGLIVILISLSSFANDFAAVLGVRTNSWDYEPAAGSSAGGNTGYQAGVLGFIDLAADLQFRSGFIYTSRVFTLKLSGAATENEYNYTYFDIPATLMYKFSEYGGVFGGAVLALNAGKSCSGSGCSNDGVKSSLIGFQFGASFKFAPQLGAELYYEMMNTDIFSYNNTSGKNAKSVVANLMFTFE